MLLFGRIEKVEFLQLHIVIATWIVKPIRVMEKMMAWGCWMDIRRWQEVQLSCCCYVGGNGWCEKEKKIPRSNNNNKMLKNLYKMMTIMMMLGTLSWRTRMFNYLPNSEQCESWLSLSWTFKKKKDIVNKMIVRKTHTYRDKC